jgi:hypothetical protein
MATRDPGDPRLDPPGHGADHRPAAIGLDALLAGIEDSLERLQLPIILTGYSFGCLLPIAATLVAISDDQLYPPELGGGFPERWLPFAYAAARIFRCVHPLQYLSPDRSDRKPDSLEMTTGSVLDAHV